MGAAQDLIAQLELQPHPEGGWFKETYRSHSSEGERALATCVSFLLEAGQKSHWHRVDADEIWLWQMGDPIDLWLAANDDGPMNTVCLGSDLETGQTLQHIVPAGHWQGAMPKAEGEHEFSLVSCVVAPGFEFSGFELANQDWHPGCGRPPK